jgi:branched-chain amino acid transport system substrate-binding protein
VFVPAGVGTVFMRQLVERGLDKSGLKVIGDGSIVEDDIINQIGDAALGVITSHAYSAAHDSAENKAFVAAFEKANDGLRPNFAAVQAYDGMRLIYEALKKTNGATDGEKLLAAMKGMAWESPRGPISIDPETRDIIQTVYIRRVEKIDGKVQNVEFDKVENVKDPVKERMKKK